MKLSELTEILKAMQDAKGGTEVKFEVIKFPDLGVALMPYSTDKISPLSR